MARVSLFALLTITLLSIVRADTTCPSDVVFTNSATDTNFAVSDKLPYTTCTTSADNIRFDDGGNPPDAVLGISTDSVSGKTACAKYSIATQTGFGTYTCKIKAQNTPGVVSGCVWGTAASGTGYQEIYFRFYGTNHTYVNLGFYTSTGSYDQRYKLSLASDADFQTYTFVYENNFIKWYINDIVFDSVTKGVGSNGNLNLPSLTGFFSVPYVTSDNSVSENTKYGVYDGKTSTIEVANMTYVPSCSNSVDISSEEAVTSSDSQEALAPWARKCTYKSPMSIYTDSLASGITDNSVNQHSVSDTTRTFAGTYSLSWVVQESSSLVFTFAKPIALSEYFALEFWVTSDQTNKQIVVSLQSGDSTIGQTLSLTSYVGANNVVPSDSWMRVQIPISDFRASGLLVDSFNQITFGLTYPDFMGTIWFDNMDLTYGAPCLTSKQQVIYGDSLASGWLDWSWGTRTLQNTDPVASGTYSISMRMYSSGIKFHSNDGVSTNDWYALSFDVQMQKVSTLSGNPDVDIGITTNNAEYKHFPLANYYGGQFPTGSNSFVTVSIPFSDFGSFANQVVDGIYFQDNSGSDQGKLLIDNIRLQKKATDPALGGSNSADSSFASPVASCSFALLVITAAALML